jgi:broad specificity phosphatase PhoE
MTRELVLVRHPKVASDYREICYGQMDVPLSSEWEHSLFDVLTLLKRRSPELLPTQVWHSGLSRTHQPAKWLARQLGIEVCSSENLRERNFGSWQGVRWDAIPKEEVEQSHDMIERPDDFRPGGGETTSELQQRALQWLTQASQSDDSGRTILAVAHSGTITCIAGALLQLRPVDWTPYYLKPSQYLVLSLLTQE